MMISHVTRLLSRLACGFGFLAIVGCSDGGGTGGTGGSGAGATGGTEAVTLVVTVVGGEPPGAPPLEGADVCETDTDNCAVTDSNGRATIEVEVPADRRISFTYEKDGYLSILRTDIVDRDFTGQYPSGTVSDERMMLVSDALMTPYPFQETGMAVISTDTGVAGVVLGGVPGVVLELVGASSEAFYYEPDHTPTRDLTSTTVDGDGGFFEVSPSQVEILLRGAPPNCAVQLGWPGSEPDSVRVPVRAGFLSWSRVLCDPS